MVIPSVLNIRPIGGELLREKSERDANLGNTLNVKVYRSGRLDNVTDEDLQYIADELGIKTVFDLRNFEQEYEEADGAKRLDAGHENDSRLRAIDVNRTTNDKFYWIDVSKFSTRKYPKTVEHNIQHTFIDFACISMVFGMMKRSLTFFQCIVDYDKVPICSVLRLMNDPGNLPCIICCHAGKDRTGILCALILSIIGISNNEIASDYSMSSIGIPESHPELSKYRDCIRKADAGTMLSLLRYIEDRYGSVSDFLISVGFSKKEQEELKNKIICNDT